MANKISGENKLFPVYLFLGEERYLKDQALAELKKRLFPKATNVFDFQTFFATDFSDTAQLQETLTSLPVSSPLRLIFIKEIENFSRELKQASIDYCRKPSKKTCLVLESAALSLKDDFFLSIHSFVKLVAFNRLGRKETFVWLEQKLKQEKQKMGQEASERLVQNCGQDLSFLAANLEKLILYTQDKGEISLEDVEKIVEKGISQSVFELGKAIFSKQREQAIAILERLVGQGEQIVQIFGYLSWHFFRLFQGHILKQKGAGEREILAQLRIGFSQSEDFLSQLRQVDSVFLKKFLAEFLLAESMIKAGRLKPELALEAVLFKTMI
jgi:DNA polymerase-3 subunit delta